MGLPCTKASPSSAHPSTGKHHEEQQQQAPCACGDTPLAEGPCSPLSASLGAGQHGFGEQRQVGAACQLLSLVPVPTEPAQVVTCSTCNNDPYLILPYQDGMVHAGFAQPEATTWHALEAGGNQWFTQQHHLLAPCPGPFVSGMNVIVPALETIAQHYNMLQHAKFHLPMQPIGSPCAGSSHGFSSCVDIGLAPYSTLSEAPKPPICRLGPQCSILSKSQAVFVQAPGTVIQAAMGCVNKSAC